MGGGDVTGTTGAATGRLMSARPTPSVLPRTKRARNGAWTGASAVEAFRSSARKGRKRRTSCSSSPALTEKAMPDVKKRPKVVVKQPGKDVRIVRDSRNGQFVSAAKKAAPARKAPSKKTVK